MKFLSTVLAAIGVAATVDAVQQQGQPFGSPGSGYNWIPDTQKYEELPVHVGFGNTIDNYSGMLVQRFPNAPKPDIPNMVPFEGEFYHAPTNMNMWTYTGSPFQPFNNPRSPNFGMIPSQYAYDAHYNTVNLSTGEIFNNNQTPPPHLPSGENNGKYYVRPQSQWMFRQNPLQPYNQAGSTLNAPNEAEIPFGYAPNGFQYGYNPFTVSLVSAYVPELNNFYDQQALPPLRQYVAPAAVPVTVAATPYTSLPYTSVTTTTPATTTPDV